jgi:hypothetical protein
MGYLSINARIFASSYSMAFGSLPAIIEQKTQGELAIM